MELAIEHQYKFQTADSAKALFVFAHGAGADMNHPFIDNFSTLLLDAGISVLRFNFPYMDKRALDGKRRPPDRMPKLLACYKDIIEKIDTKLPLFIGGKSMGSRVAVMVQQEISIELAGVICLGYPFHPPKKTDKLRLTPLQETQIPTLIIQGERDTLGNKAEVMQYDVSNACQFVFMPDGDHDFKPRVKSGKTHSENIHSAVNACQRFINEHI